MKHLVVKANGTRTQHCVLCPCLEYAMAEDEKEEHMESIKHKWIDEGQLFLLILTHNWKESWAIDGWEEYMVTA